MCIFHKWTKWEVISDKMVSFTTILGGAGVLREIIQVRECSKCGKKQYDTTEI